MSRFLATINVPGYLPMDDDPPVFDTPTEAWEYLAAERRCEEDEGPNFFDGPGPYSETVDRLDAWASAGHGPDFFIGDTPGYDHSDPAHDHDLGLVYTVTEVDDEGVPLR